ncbi:MAG TPA: zinc ABC transporter substrate-binding protein [Microbacterium sp.]|nr:zinc ABC transporter substrate-binding protein [Microbacterium sp.]
MTLRRLAAPVALAAASVLLLAGCATVTDAAASDDRIAVVASTNVYAQIAEEIGGEFVEVTPIVSSAGQDPHSFEPSARDQLTIQRADLIVENGGGYDAFVDALIEASGSTAPVVTAVEFSHDWPDNAGHEEKAEPADDEHGDHAHEHVEGFNEHVWYDPHTIEHVAEQIAHELGELLPAKADTFEASAAAFADGVATLETALAEIETTDAGAEVFVTEPVPLYLVAAAGLVNVTPDAFTEAVEEGQDVSPSTLLGSFKLLRAGEARVVIANTQTGGAETAEMTSEAESLEIPVVEFSETLPDGQTYLSWMQANIEALAGGLGR